MEDHIEQSHEQFSSVTQQSKQRKWLIMGAFLVLLCSLLVIITYFDSGQSIKNPPQGSRDKTQSEHSALTNPSPTPMPFAEMTIPALRNREFSSELEERSLLANNGSYDSYLTSYDSDGLKINGLLTIPTGDQPEDGWPAIIFIHGYIPPTVYTTTGQYADYVDYLARNGFVVFKIDLRGHGDSEGDASGAYYSGDYIIDTLNARAALASSDFVQSDAIGLWGHSMAGNVVMRSLAVMPDIPAAVIWGGAVFTYEDWQKYGIQDNSYRPPTMNNDRQRRRQRLREIHGEPDLSKPFWQQMSPVSYLKDIDSAIQLNHAVDDEVVNIGYSRDLASLLEKTDIAFEKHEYQTGGHNISGSAFASAMENTVNFFNKHLK